MMNPIKSDPVKTGAYIARLRKEHEMTQLALATAMLVSHQAVSKWETGGALPDIDTLLAIATLFDVSLDSLIAGEDVEPSDSVEQERIEYSETMACVIKTRNDLPLLLEAYEEMQDEDIADCIQTLGIADLDILVRLFERLSSAKMAQVIKSRRLVDLLELVAGKMDVADITDCIQTLGITDAATIRALCSR